MENLGYRMSIRGKIGKVVYTTMDEAIKRQRKLRAVGIAAQIIPNKEDYQFYV
ncbi:hypothetical protein D3C73_1498130 [compost metagenome]